MANKERIDYLLLDIRELEKQVAAIRDAEVYPLSFFSQSFELAHKILTDLHTLEADQLEVLSRQMEEHRRRIHNIPSPEVTLQAEIIEEESEEKQSEPEITQTVIVYNLKKEPSPDADPAAEPETKETSEPLSESAENTEEDNIAVILDELLPDIPEEKITNPVVAPPPSISLNEVIQKKNLSDFRKAFSLNDRFRFRRELFGGDEGRMNKAIADLNELHSYEDSITYLHRELKWNPEDPAIEDFIKLLEKRFL